MTQELEKEMDCIEILKIIQIVIFMLTAYTIGYVLGRIRAPYNHLFFAPLYFFQDILSFFRRIKNKKNLRK